MTLLELSLNIDGIPLHKSSSNSLWPIICCVCLEPVKVFSVALCYGRTKPSDLEIFKDTVAELGQILHDGIVLNDRQFKIALKCIVCDAPARALIKATKLCSGYFGCDKFSQRGEWQDKMIYPKY